MYTFMHAQYGAAARHSAANAGSATVTAELTRLNTDLLSAKLHRDLEESFLENDGKIVCRVAAASVRTSSTATSCTIVASCVATHTHKPSYRPYVVYFAS